MVIMKVGDYIRTKDGKIFKWNNLCTTDVEDFMEHTRKILYIEDEIKSSPNIIDLIQVGDYVNGSRVIFVDKKDKHITVSCSVSEDGMFYEKDIKSIVTHEQFESMKYEVGE